MQEENYREFYVRYQVTLEGGLYITARSEREARHIVETDSKPIFYNSHTDTEVDFGIVAVDEERDEA